MDTFYILYGTDVSVGICFLFGSLKIVVNDYFMESVVAFYTEDLKYLIWQYRLLSVITTIYDH